MSERLYSYLLVHIATLLYGVTGIIGKLIQLDAVSLVWVRLIFAISVLFIWFRIKGISTQLNSRKDVYQMMFTGVLLALHWVTFFHSIKVSNVTIALISFSTFPLFTAILEPLFYKKSIRIIDLCVAFIIILGTYICFPNFSFQSEYAEGIIVGFISGLLIAVVWVSSHDLSQKYSGYTNAYHQLLYACVFLTCLNVYQFDVLFKIASVDWLYLAVLGVLCTAITTVFSYTAMKVLSAYSTSIVINLEPVYGILLAVLFFPESETMSSNIYIGGALILGAAFIEPLFSSKKETELVS